MLDPKKARPWNGDGKPATELTSTQLVIGTCIFLVAALICFALGFVLGRYEEASSHEKAARTVVAQATPETPLPPPPRSEPAQTPLPPEGNQVSPRRVVMPPPKPQAPGYPSSPNATGTPSKVTDHPAPPKPETPPPPETPAAPAPAQVPVTAPATNAPAAPPPPPTEPAPAAPKPAETQAAAVQTPPVPPPVTPPAGTAPASVPAPAPVAAQPAAPAPASSNGLYAIQVASLTGPARKERADEYKRRLETNADLKAELAVSEDGKTIRVLIGNYPDRETATKACEELKKRAGFKDSFVKRK